VERQKIMTKVFAVLLTSPELEGRGLELVQLHRPGTGLIASTVSAALIGAGLLLLAAAQLRRPRPEGHDGYAEGYIDAIEYRYQHDTAVPGEDPPPAA
jgi:hypothetical protein